MSAPLEGIRVLEIGTVITAPTAGRLLADLGAEVIKVEPPGGDPLRTWGISAPDGTSWWFKSHNRGKKFVTFDLHDPQAVRTVRVLARTCDVLIENFRPGVIEKWGLGYETLSADNPRLVYVAISGYGQDGPYAKRAGFGNIGEAMGGIRYVTGEADGPPMRAGVSIGDELTGMYAAMGALAALQARERTGRGDFVDVALTEAVFSVMEAALPEYGAAGVVRGRHGNRYLRAAPNNQYQAADGEWVVIAGNGDSIFRRLCGALGRPELADDPRYADNRARTQNAAELDAAIGEWVGSLPAAEVNARCVAAGVPVGPIMSIAEMAQDPQFLARGMIAKTADENGVEVSTPGIVPRFRNHPTRLGQAAGAIGRDAGEVLGNPGHSGAQPRASAGGGVE